MGIYNTYVDEKKQLNAQLKVGDLRCATFKVGAKAEIEDGIYFDRSAAVVVEGGKVAAVTSQVYDKYGAVVNFEKLSFVIFGPADTALLNLAKRLAKKKRGKK